MDIIARRELYFNAIEEFCEGKECEKCGYVRLSSLSRKECYGCMKDYDEDNTYISFWCNHPAIKDNFIYREFDLDKMSVLVNVLASTAAIYEEFGPETINKLEIWREMLLSYNAFHPMIPIQKLTLQFQTIYSENPNISFKEMKHQLLVRTKRILIINDYE